MKNELALVISDLGSGGAQRVLTALANAWAERGRNVRVITLDGPESDFFTLDDRIERIPLRCRQDSTSPVQAVMANLRRIMALRHALRQSGAPVVVAFIGTTNVLTVMATIGLGQRVIICERNDPSRQSLGRSWDALRRMTYRFADVVTANSRGAVEALGRSVPAGKLAYLPNPLVRPSGAGASAGPSEMVFLSVARLNSQKGHDVLLDAFALVADDTPGWRLVVVGEGKLRPALEAQTKRLGLAGRVDWVGRTADPYAYYAQARIFVLPSRHEGMPNALLEAMSFGLPCIITSASPGPLEWIEDGETGLVVRPDDANGLAQALKTLAVDQTLCARLGRAACNKVAHLGIAQALEVWDPVLGLSPPASPRR